MERIGWKVVTVDTIDGPEYGIDEVYEEDETDNLFNNEDAATDFCRLLAQTTGRRIYDGRDPNAPRE